MDISKLTDQEIVKAILNRDAWVTKAYLYKKCYPLFYSIYSEYYTDCDNVFEFIDEIYIYLLTPQKESGKCKLYNFSFRCTLTLWLQIVTKNFCHQLFAKKLCFVDESIPESSDTEQEDNIFRGISRKDVHHYIKLMPHERYRRIIELRYLDEKSNEDTAKILNMTMANFYNKHKLAKEQFRNVLREEGLL